MHAPLFFKEKCFPQLYLHAHEHGKALPCVCLASISSEIDACLHASYDEMCVPIFNIRACRALLCIHKPECLKSGGLQSGGLQ